LPASHVSLKDMPSFNSKSKNAHPRIREDELHRRPWIFHIVRPADFLDQDISYTRATLLPGRLGRA
jgi:hypothetical protein